MARSGRIWFERILCPIDLSQSSGEALRYGVALARAYNSRLLLCHCADSELLADSTYRSRLDRFFEASVREHVRLPDSSTLTWEGRVLEGSPASAINQEATRQQVDLIVMRSRRRPIAAAFLGSTAEAVASTAPCPVLITHPHEQEWAGSTSNDIDLARVLVAFDFSTDSQLALSYGLSLAEEYQAELHLLHVLPVPARSDTAEISFLPVNADRRFEDAALKLHGVVPHEVYLWCAVKEAVSEGEPYDKVVEYAKGNEIDLICIGASGRGTWMQEVFGSTADRVLRHAPCPVLIARPLRTAVSKAS